MISPEITKTEHERHAHNAWRFSALTSLGMNATLNLYML